MEGLLSPEDEAHRLEAVLDYEVLDTPSEPAFEDIAQLAASVCATPTALVSLVDRDRQWFKARLGFDAAETDLSRSVCRFVVAERATVVIPDLTADPRTRDNPLVRAPGGIRFYAGAPLATAEGHVLGSLCVIDHQPRPGGLNPSQRADLEALARRTVDVLETRRIVREREAALAARDLADTARSALEARYQAIFQNLEEGFIRGRVVRDAAGRAVDWRYEEINGAWSDLTGLPSEGVVGRTIREVFPGIEDAWIDEPAQVAETGEPRRFTREVATLGRWYDGVTQPVGPDRFAVVFSEATDRVLAQLRQDALLQLGDALRDAETAGDMTRMAARIVGEALGASRASYGAVDAAVDSVTIEPGWAAEGVATIAGRYRFEDFGRISEELKRGEPLAISDVLTDPRTADDPGPLRSLDIGAIVNMPVRERGRMVAAFIVHFQGVHAWTTSELAFIRNVADRLEVGIARLRAEEQQDVLNREISHRLKNTLSMVQAVSAQTLRGIADRDAARALERRLLALGRAHDVLMQSSWQMADLQALLERVLEAAGVEGRYAVDGPAVMLGAKAALSTSLLIHELATNALKYGALTVGDGRVRIAWRLEGEAAGRELVLTWAELGGPPAETPVRKGFGSRLLGAGLVGTGGAELHYGAEGFSAIFRAALEQVQQA